PITGSSTSGNAGRKGGFGQPLYAIATTTSTAVGTTSNYSATATGFSTIGMRKNIPYVTVLGEDLPRPTYVLNRQELQAILDRSPIKSNVSVQVAGTKVTLRGEVATAREKRLAEGVLRLTPGVRDVDNQLRITALSARK